MNGRPPKLKDEHKDEIRNILKSSPRLYGYQGKRKWTNYLICKELKSKYGVSVSEPTISRTLGEMYLESINKFKQELQNYSKNVENKYTVVYLYRFEIKFKIPSIIILQHHYVYCLVSHDIETDEKNIQLLVTKRESNTPHKYNTYKTFVTKNFEEIQGMCSNIIVISHQEPWEEKISEEFLQNHAKILFAPHGSGDQMLAILESLKEKIYDWIEEGTFNERHIRKEIKEKGENLFWKLIQKHEQ